VTRCLQRWHRAEPKSRSTDGGGSRPYRPTAATRSPSHSTDGGRPGSGAVRTARNCRCSVRGAGYRSCRWSSVGCPPRARWGGCGTRIVVAGG
jgi:hypothetical protein